MADMVLVPRERLLAIAKAVTSFLGDVGHLYPSYTWEHVDELDALANTPTPQPLSREDMREIWREAENCTVPAGNWTLEELVMFRILAFGESIQAHFVRK